MRSPNNNALRGIATLIAAPILVGQMNLESSLFVDEMKGRRQPLAVSAPVGDLVIGSASTAGEGRPVFVSADTAGVDDWIRLELEVESVGDDIPSGFVRIRNGHGEIIWGELAENLHPWGWTPDLSQDRFYVSSSSDDTVVTVRSIMVHRAPVLPESIVGRAVLDDLDKLNEDATALAARAVALIEYQDSFQGQDAAIRTALFSCTGFLVSPSVLITNAHCALGEENSIRARVYFDYVSEARPNHFVGVKRVIAVSDRHDAALLELTHALSRSRVPRLGALISAPQELRLIQQFKGGPIKVSHDEECVAVGKVNGPFYTNSGGQTCTMSALAFEHGCDTENRSSGSPMFDPDQMTIVGLHFWGFENSGYRHNRAIDMEQLACWIDEVANRETALFSLSEREAFDSVCSVPGAENCWPDQ